MNNKPIPAFVHGIADYIGGLVLLAAPEIFNFAFVGGPAVMIPRLLGIIVIVQSLFTDNEVGVVPAISMRMHLFNDYVAGAFLAVSPWLFRFSFHESRVWLPHLIIGLAIIVLTALTNPVPTKNVTRRGQTPLGGVSR